jgi:hypothetical protein
MESLVNAKAKDPHFNMFASDHFTDWVNSLYEITELVAIHKGLSRVDYSEDLAFKLKKFTEGPVFASSEKLASASNAARDVAFELFTASLFASAGYSLDFGTQADIAASDDSHTILVECKRPRADHSVNGCIKWAASQLRKRYRVCKPSDEVFGIVALSIDNVVNPKHYILSTSNEQELDATLRARSQEFVLTFWKHWKVIDDPQTMGLVTLHQTVAFPESHNIITSCNFISGDQAPHAAPETFQVFAKVYQGLQTSVLQSHQGDLRSPAI